MNLSKLIIILSCLLTTLACSAAKYQIKVLNTPTITIDNREAKVGDWFTDESVIVWNRDNQAMRVVSDENKVYTLSAKLYKEAKAKKFSDFILYTKPLAARGTNNLDLIEQLAERFDNTFVMLDEIVIDLSDLELSTGCRFQFCFDKENLDKNAFEEILCNDKIIITREKILSISTNKYGHILLSVLLFRNGGRQYDLITESFIVDLLPI